MIKWLRSTVALLSPVGTKAKRNKTGGEGRPKEIVAQRERELGRKAKQ